MRSPRRAGHGTTAGIWGDLSIALVWDWNYANESLVDDDNDGVLNPQDDCPLQPEDVDGFEDEMDAPTRITMADSIPDANDPCPNEPEDEDGFQDNDGCPDLDNDEDGVSDSEDQCPSEREDKDDFQDDDGCPDLDDDEDGILDTEDWPADSPQKTSMSLKMKTVALIPIMTKMDFLTTWTSALTRRRSSMEIKMTTDVPMKERKP